MDDLFIARLSFAQSLAFHIVFAAIGIGMPLLMVIAEYLWLRSGEKVYLNLAKRWATGTAILFAVGAVSGTVIAFELGLLWPGFMRYAGAIIGMPFSMEGFAFFTEAIFLGIYLYGWDKVPRKAHLFAGVLVAISGALSGIFVVTANSWMNSPSGFRLENGVPMDIDPIAAMFNPGWVHQTLHMTIAAYMATAAGVAGVHAYMLLRQRGSIFHRRALAISLSVLGVTALLQPISGDLNARYTAKYQPEKLAAMEGQFETERGAPLRIGGIPDMKKGTVDYAIEIPYGLSLLAFHDPHAEVKGLNAFPPDERPNATIIHIAFQIMVACGMALLLASIASAVQAWRKRGVPESPLLLKYLVFCAPLGFVAIEAGWTVTEVGRQPWVIYRVLRTADAVTPMPGLIVPFVTFSLIYIFLTVVVITLLRRQIVFTDPAGNPAEEPDGA
jgi:cytochrome bd ubiquinol oxidase subunit I